MLVTMLPIVVVIVVVFVVFVLFIVVKIVRTLKAKTFFGVPSRILKRSYLFDTHAGTSIRVVIQTAITYTDVLIIVS